MSEPVAWISKSDLEEMVKKNYYECCVSNEKLKTDIPLYTHPAELTDEEINKIYLEKYDGHMGFLSPDEVRDFAKAILRKASKK